MVASGSDITQSAVGRLQAESVWLPSVFCSDDVSWTKMDSSHLHSSFVVQGERGELDFTIDNAFIVKLGNRECWNPDSMGVWPIWLRL